MPQRVLVAVVVALTLSAFQQGASAGDFAPAAKLLEQRCLRCHNEETRKGKLSLATREAALAGGESGAAIAPGKRDESLLLEMVSGDSPAMPKQGRPLSRDEVDVLRNWIAEGADWPADKILTEQAPLDRSWWSLQPVRRPPLPNVANIAWARNPIDLFILAELEKGGLGPSQEADRRTLLRRLSLDVWGLPPSTEEVEAFVASTDERAYEKAVEAKLSSQLFGERYARHWLDVVRFAETHGFEMNQERPNAWPYRDYVIDAFARDVPYDRFLAEQLAGDQLGAEAATGFLVAGPWDQVRSPDPVLTANQRADELHDMVSTFGGAVLGLTVGCARCHNHKFDPIPQTDYYALKAVFAGVEHGERSLTPPDAAERTAKLAEIDRQRSGLLAQLRRGEPLAFQTKVVTIHTNDPRVKQLVPTEGVAAYASGVERGQRDFAGSAKQLPTLGKGYLYWHNVAGRDMLAWTPKVEGNYRAWVSWGCGWKTHATDARYLLDDDGDLATKADQREIARVNHQKFAAGDGEVPNQPLWSGFLDLGVQRWTPATTLVLRAGDSDAYVSADAIVLVEERDTKAMSQPPVRVPVVRGTNVDRFAAVDAKFLRFTVLATNNLEPCIDELEVFTAGENPRNIALAAAGAKVTASGTYPNAEIHRLPHIHDGLYGNSHSWISNEIGHGWVQYEFPEAATVDTAVWGRDQSQSPQFADRLATEYRIEVSLDGNAWTTVASSGDRLPIGTPVPGGKILGSYEQPDVIDALSRLDALEKQAAALRQTPTFYGGRLTSPGATMRLHRGDPLQPREEVPPGAISVLQPNLELAPSASNAERRMALAQWTTNRENPLTARVIVNRLWQWHFGEGLVDTPSDFGVNGARPTHPELLDYLAAELIDHDWSLRHIHRLILTSATYRQASAHRAECAQQDSGTRYLWRYPPHRLEAEVLRDTMLTITGQLRHVGGGPGFSAFEPNTNYVRVYTPKTQFGEADFRRMIYMTKIRMQVDPTFGPFDCPDGGQTAPKRSRSTTPLQAFNLLNSPFALDQAKAFARRLEAEAGGDASARVKLAFALALQRPANERELAASVAAIERHGLLAFCRALLNSNELVYLD